MPTLRISEVEVTQAVLRLAAVQDTLPDDVVRDLQLLISAVDERGSSSLPPMPATPSTETVKPVQT